MKINVTETREKEVSSIRCLVAVRYEEDDMPNDYPHRHGDMWDVTIDIETGQIRDWPNGVAARHLYMKVCDSGSYYLLTPDGSIVAKREEDYVIDCIPQEYGDYIDFRIDDAGKIENWQVTAGDIEESFFNREDADQ